MSALVKSSDFTSFSDTAYGSVGDGWVDPNTKYRTLGGELIHQTPISSTHLLARPVGESDDDTLISVVFKGSLATTGNSAYPALRYTSGSLTGVYFAQLSTTAGSGLRISRGSTLLASAAFTLNPSTTYRLSLAARNNAGNVDLEARIAAEGDPNTALQTVTFTDSSVDKNTAAGLQGIRFLGTAAAVQGLLAETYAFDGSWPTFTGLTPTAGANTLTVTTHESVTLVSAAATGGVGDKTYQWHRSTDPTFTPSGGNAVSGATSLTLVDTPPTLDWYYYTCVATDEAAQAVHDNHVGARLRDGVASDYVLGFIGDSLFDNPAKQNRDGVTSGDPFTGVSLYSRLTVPDVVGMILSADHARGGLYTWTISNYAVGGSGTPDWDAADDPYMAAALTAFDTANVTHVNVRLGTNDAINLELSAEDYATNLTECCAVLTGQGYKVILHYPLWFPPGPPGTGSQTDHARLLAYFDAIDALVNGTTILQGDTLAPRFFAENMYLGEEYNLFMGEDWGTPDYVHHSVMGIAIDAMCVAGGIKKALGLGGGGSGSNTAEWTAVRGMLASAGVETIRL